MVLVGLVGMMDNSCHFKVYIIYFLYQSQIVQSQIILEFNTSYKFGGQESRWEKLLKGHRFP